MKTKDVVTLFVAAVVVVIIIMAFVNDRDDAAEPVPADAQAPTSMGFTEQRLREKRVTDVCEESVKQQLKDPDSAQFRAESARPDTPEGAKWLVTGEFNARNSFGGMVGYTAFTCVATYGPSDEARGEASILGR